jgi:hypothetical protein
VNGHDEERTADQRPWRLAPGLLLAGAVTTRLVAAGLLRVVPDVLAETSPGAGRPNWRPPRCAWARWQCRERLVLLAGGFAALIIQGNQRPYRARNG